jgi:glyoxylase-like metal-dependent hydrolase (beta-lactamase superfamily II)
MTLQNPETPWPQGLTVLERGWLSANNIVLQGPHGAAVIDTGYATHAPQTLALLASTLKAEPLVWLLNTHLHSDHCGGNAALQQAYPGMYTRIPPGQAQWVHHWDPVALTYVPTGQICTPFKADGLLVPGTELPLGSQVWQVHAAPGHDTHSVVLFEPVTRTLLSADALWEHGFGVVFPELDGISAFDDVASTLDVIESLQPLRVIPGHGRPFTDVAGALARARQRLAAFVASPAKHTSHACKVLLKFKLLELQNLPQSQLLAWAQATPYLGQLAQRHSPGVPLDTWMNGLLDSLVASGAATRSTAANGQLWVHNA